MDKKQEIFNGFFTKGTLLDQHFNKQEVVEIEKYKILYHKVNNMLAESEIHCQDPLVMAVMDALHEIDGGTYNEKI